MNIYKVTYEGSYLSGRAIVIANTPEDAIAMVAKHPQTQNFKNATVEIAAEGAFDGVIYNASGEY